MNSDFLRRLSAFDPELPQKKMAIRRVKKLIRGWWLRRAVRNIAALKHREIRKQGSHAAELLFEWLVVSCDLHHKYVRSKANLSTKKNATASMNSLESLKVKKTVNLQA